MPAWPAALPRPMSDGYSIEPVDPIARTEMEAGPSRSRRRTRARQDRLKVMWEMTDAQLLEFRQWFDSDAGAAGGASWFTVTLAIGAGGMTNTTAKFASIFSVIHRGGLQWTVSADLEIR